MNAPTDPTIVAASSTKESRESFFSRYPWIVYVAPLALFMLVTSLEPTPPSAEAAGWLDYWAYPWVYTAKIAIVLSAMVLVSSVYRQVPFRVGPWAVPVGMVGALIWIALCRLHVEDNLGVTAWLGGGSRSSFNPFEQLADTPAWAWAFLAIRFFGLIVVVPVVEEFFLRGFLMRFFVQQRWWEVPLGTVNTVAVVVGTLVPMAMHPGELVAAAVWFSMITLLLVRTRNIWDCVVAHGVTNAGLGAYALWSGDWSLL